MIRAMLEERFGVRVHDERRETSVYALMVVKPGATGPRLNASAVDCAKEIGDQARGDTPRQLANGRFACVAGGTARAVLGNPDAFADRPSIFTALQQQLGLPLEAARGMVDVLVVDAAQAPSPD